MADCNDTYSDAYIAAWSNPRLASLYAVLAITFILLYIPCIIVMKSKELWANTCYKIMFAVGILDIGNLSINAIGPSIFMFLALGMDCYPLINQILSCWLCELIWNAYCFMSVTLLIHRCVFMASSSRWNKILFSEGRVWIWIAAAIAYGFIYVAAYASPYGTLRFHSGIGIYMWPPTDKIGIEFTTFNNTATAFLIPAGYVVLAVMIRKRRTQAGAENPATTAAEKRLHIQAVLICAPTCIASFFYYLARPLTVQIIVYQCLQVIWIVANGCNGLIYLTLNITIRNKVIKLIGLNKLIHGKASARIAPLNFVSPTIS